MKRIIVFSDSHGDAQALKTAYELALKAGGIHTVVFLGDGLSDFDALKPLLAANGTLHHAVRGNNDWSRSEPAELCFSVCGVRFYACHGHAWHVKYGLDRLWYAARECEAQVALYGHTHRADVELERGMYLVNPGAVCERYRGIPYADIRVEENGGVRVKLMKGEG